MKLKKVLFIVGFSVFLLFILVITEVYLRVFEHEVLKTQTFPLIYEPDSIHGYSYIPNVISYHITPSYNTKVTTNKNGFFGPEFSTKKPDGIFRAVIVSYSLASGGDFINLMQSEINTTGLRNVELINCSIDGKYLNWHHYLMIKTKLMKYSPDVVLFNTEIPFSRKDYTRECYHGYVMEYDPHEASSRVVCMEAINDIEGSVFLTSLYDNSYIVRAICKKLTDKFEYEYGSFTQKYIAPYRKKKILSGEFAHHDYTVEETVRYLQNLSDTLNNSTLVLFDYFLDEFGTGNKTICRNNGIHYINLGLEIPYYNANLSLEHDGHPNQRGYEEIAHRFVTQLRPYLSLPLPSIASSQQLSETH